MIFYFILLIVILIVVKNIYDLQQFSHSAELVQLQNPNHITIKELILVKSPIVIHNLVGKYNDISSLTIDSLIHDNPGYIINDNGKNEIVIMNGQVLTAVGPGTIVPFTKGYGSGTM